MIGSFCWVGLATSEPASACAFYTLVFGWAAENRHADPVGPYTVLQRGDEDVALLYRQTETGRAAPPHWTPYISTDDVDTTTERAVKLGGNLVREPLDLDGVARIAALRDPAGAVISLWQARRRHGATLVGGVGTLCWNELVTDDLDGAKQFYGRLLGWTFEPDAASSASIRNRGERIARIQFEHDVAARWTPYFGVESIDAIRRVVTALGGDVIWVSTRSSAMQLGVFADPQGAAFGALELA